MIQKRKKVTLVMMKRVSYDCPLENKYCNKVGKFVFYLKTVFKCICSSK